MSMDKIFMCDEQKFCSRVVSPSEFLHHSVQARNILERTMQLRHDDVSPIDHFANLAGTTVDVSKTIFELCETEISRLKDPDTNFNFDVETGFDDSVVPRYPLKIFEHLQNERERRLNPQNKSIALRAMRYDVIDPRLITNKGFNIKGIPDKWKEETKIGRPAVPEQNPEIPPNVTDNPDVMPAPEPSVTLRSQNLPWGHDDVLIYVSVYLGYGRTLQYHEIRLGRLMKVTDRLVLRGDQTLYDLKKSFHCLQDYMCLEDVSHRNPTPDDLTLNLFPSSYFFIHDTFFIDDRKEGAKDTSECVRTWAQGRTNIDEMYVDNMDTKLIDLKFRLGQPYLYQHQGICEHTIVFTDYHLRDYNDQVGPYPLRLLERQFRRIACIGCRTENADWAVMGCEILPTTPAYLCRNCYKDLLFHADGNKRCNFQAVPYFDRKAMDDYGVFLDMLRKNVLPVKKEEANENEEGFGVQPSQPVAKRRRTVDVDDDDDMSSYTGAGSIRSLDSSDSGSMSGERPITYLNARPDASGYRTGNPVPMANGRHTFYHVIITDEQRTAVDASLRKLGISFGREQTPMKFDIAQKTIANMRSQFNRETSDHGNTRKLRQMEKETLEGIYDTCMYKMANLEKSAQRESPEDPSAYMAEHNLYASFLRSTMNAIEGVQNKVRQEQEQYMKNKRQAIDEEKRRMYLREGRRYTTVATSQPAATATATVIVKPKDEGAINVLDLLGGEDDDGEKTDDTKDLPLLEGEHLAEGEEESPTTSAQKNFQEALARNHQSGESDDGGADDDGLTAPQLEKFIDDDLKPPKLELDGEEAGEELPPPIRIPFLTRRPINGEPLMKRPRILGHNGVTYKVVQPTGRFVPRGAVKIREQGEGRMTVAEMGMNKVHSINTIAGLPVTLRPTSSTVLPADVRDKLIADGLTKHQTGAMKPVVQRVNSIVYRKDYKNPPTPLPADDGTHVLCHLCDNRIMCTRLSNLTNHVRRHSAAKQYQCAHCTYQHNEQAKVRLHMTNNHDDETSQPVDNLTKDMQKVWEYLMDECFPGYLEQLKQAQPHSSVNWDRAGGSRGSRGETGPTTLEELHTCSECGSAISVNAHQQNTMMITEPLVEHLMTEHRELCIAQVCGECDYANADEWKVRWHISTRHEKGASEIPVNTAPEGEHIDLFLYKFFPSIENVLGPRDDPEESELKDAMGGNDPNPPTTAAIPARPSRISPGPAGLICKEEANSEDEEALDKSFLKSRFPQPGKIDVSKLGEKEVLCELCNKILIWENKNTLCTLLAHAKRHFKIKQFQCQICSYASSESQHVKQHMLQRHNEVARPKEHNNEFMQNSWLSVMRKCFPLLRERIDNFKFKTAKSLARQEREEKEREKMGDRKERTPPRHGYGTRRKRTLQEK